MNDLKITEIREKLSMTQEEFAAKVGVSVRTVQNWESGGVIPSTSRKKIQDLMNEAVPTKEDTIGRLVTIMEKDHQLIREIMEKKDETIDRLITILEVRALMNPLMLSMTAVLVSVKTNDAIPALRKDSIKSCISMSHNASFTSIISLSLYIHARQAFSTPDENGHLIASFSFHQLSHSSLWIP